MAKYRNLNTRSKNRKSQKPKGDPPIQEYRFGQVKVCVWEKETEYGPQMSFSLHKSWKPEDGDWVNEKIGLYRPIELVNVIQSCQKALDFRYGAEEEEDSGEEDLFDN